VDEEVLRPAFRSLHKQAASGADGQSYDDYAAQLDHNLRDLYARLKSGRYQAPVIRRVYIPKAKGQLRPIGITTIRNEEGFKDSVTAARGTRDSRVQRPLGCQRDAGRI
jgi:retron-type reverse transcriptase